MTCCGNWGWIWALRSMRTPCFPPGTVPAGMAAEKSSCDAFGVLMAGVVQALDFGVMEAA